MSRTAMLLVVLFAIAGPPALAGEPTALFLKLPGGGAFGPPMLDPPGVAAIVEHQVNPNIAGLLANPDELLIDLPGQPAFTVSRGRYGTYPWPLAAPPKDGDSGTGALPMVHTWSGYDGSIEVVLTFTDELVAGYINLGEYRFVIDYREHDGPDDPGQLLTEVDPKGFPDCAVGQEGPKLVHTEPKSVKPYSALAPTNIESGTEPMVDTAPRAEYGATVDVLALYTPTALAHVGSVNGMTMRVLNPNDQLNEAIIKSDVRNTRVRVVGIEEIAFNENNGVTPTATRWLGYRSWVRLDPSATSRRDAYQADLVVMLVHDNAAGAPCGVAYVQRPDCGLDAIPYEPGCDVGEDYNSFAYSIVHVGCSQANAIYAHEVGHQFGAEHQPQYAYAGIGSFVWSYAHYVNLVARDVMAYASDCTSGNCPMQLHFSNPHVNFFDGAGPPTGSFAPESMVDSRYRYSAKTLQYLAQGVANFRGATAPEPPRESRRLIGVSHAAMASSRVC